MRWKSGAVIKVIRCDGEFQSHRITSSLFRDAYEILRGKRL